ncbi:RND multidrug efflux transporter, Acriflavin resistance protein [Klebsiella pneumoniae]|uniref:RND multidrug efflux transporter, Acriflavin resistance protein n=1 Tax=Klebsiella pneumoniae TaxID=573 RepID=A0A377W597_KLEPN|nr:RND multidrug efflux transporter, Acriflavin resistance protein [Klebsiella pneumoniae]
MLAFFIRRPRFAMVIALLLTFVGAVSLKLIPVEQYPAITPPVVNVSASWPGASASDVAEAIAAPAGDPAQRRRSYAVYGVHQLG